MIRLPEAAQDELITPENTAAEFMLYILCIYLKFCAGISQLFYKTSDPILSLNRRSKWQKSSSFF